MKNIYSFSLTTLCLLSLFGCGSQPEKMASGNVKTISANATEQHSLALQSGNATLVSDSNIFVQQALLAMDQVGKNDVPLPQQTKDKLTNLLIKLRQGGFDFDLTQCNNANKCQLKSYQKSFAGPMRFLKKTVDRLDKSKVDIFQRPGNDWLKNIILLADHYRQQSTFPMSVKGDQLAFLRSYFADHIVYSSRQFNPAQRDMGNFSRSDFSHITPVSKNITLASKKNFRATGAYALPGQTFTVTRTDNTNEGTYVFINTLRPGSTQAFSTKGKTGQYNRPEFLRSVHYDIAPGETVAVTSPYGGPIQIGFASSAGKRTSFAFSNVGEHAYYNGDNSPAAVKTFHNKLAANEYDWAEFATDYFEIHSKSKKMKETLALRPEYKNLAPLTRDINQYTHNLLRVEAGFQGKGIDVVPEIHRFAQQHRLPIVTWDTIHHFNADQPTCGVGCSGNPYDARWSFKPTGHGDLHEIGHTIERKELRFKGWTGHSSTNHYAYYVKSQLPVEGGYQRDCKAMEQAGYLSKLQQAAKTSDPRKAMAAHKLNDWKDGASISVQSKIVAQHYGELNNGWHLLPRKHILLRAFKGALKSEKDWLKQRNNLGFDQFNYRQAKKISQNDWQLVSTSYAAKLDYSDYYKMWGFEFSDTAKAQVAKFNFKQVPRVFFNFEPKQYCETFDITPTQIQ